MELELKTRCRRPPRGSPLFPCSNTAGRLDHYKKLLLVVTTPSEIITMACGSDFSIKQENIFTLTKEDTPYTFQWLEFLHKDTKGCLTALQHIKERVTEAIFKRLPILASSELPYLEASSMFWQCSGINSLSQGINLFSKFHDLLCQEEKVLEKRSREIQDMLLQCEIGLKFVNRDDSRSVATNSSVHWWSVEGRNPQKVCQKGGSSLAEIFYFSRTGACKEGTILASVYKEPSFSIPGIPEVVNRLMLWDPGKVQELSYGGLLSNNYSGVHIIMAHQRGVWVIALDIWPNATKDNTGILQGRTLTSPPKLIRSIQEYAFSASPYLGVITLENPSVSECIRIFRFIGGNEGLRSPISGSPTKKKLVITLWDPCPSSVPVINIHIWCAKKLKDAFLDEGTSFHSLVLHFLI